MPVNSAKINFPGLPWDPNNDMHYYPAWNTGYTIAIYCNDVAIDGPDYSAGTIDIDIIAEDGTLIKHKSIVLNEGS